MSILYEEIGNSITKCEKTYILPLQSIKTTLNPATEKNMLILTSNIYLPICKHTLIRYSLKCIFSGIKTRQLATFWACKVLFRSIIIKALSSLLHLCIVYTSRAISCQPGAHLNPDKDKDPRPKAGSKWFSAQCSILAPQLDL